MTEHILSIFETLNLIPSDVPAPLNVGLTTDAKHH